MLSSPARPLVVELAATENISSCGARVQSERPWKPTTPVLVQSPNGELLARARVVYCQSLTPGTFALGLRFEVRTGGWIFLLE